MPVSGKAHDWIAAPPTRVWMDATPRRFANRCLPLLIANQYGWLVLNPVRVTLRWDGTRDKAGLEVDSHEKSSAVLSHFGQGIATWSVPYLFRTPPGWDLWVRGPSNCPKDGVYPLDAVVETDWSVATFTMNWQLTRPGLEVTFEAGEPYAMVLPQRRGDIERFRPVLRDLDHEGEGALAYAEWARGRVDFNSELASGCGDRSGPGWQRDYFQGRLEGRRVAGHRTWLRVREPVDERTRGRK